MKEIGHLKINNQTTHFYLCEKNLVYIERQDQISTSQTIIETFANNWFIGFLTNPKTHFKLRSQNKWIESAAPLGILVPPFSLLEWQLEPGHIEWRGFFSKTPFSYRRLQKPLVFPFSGEIPRSYQELFVLTQNIPQDQEIEISKDNSWLSQKVKETIDATFKDELKVEDIASRLKVHRSFMTRSFKNSYGLTPVEYRHKLRIFEGLKLMNQEYLEITQAALDSGFSSIQRFEEHFKEQIGINPSQFSFSKIKKEATRTSQ